MKKINQESSLTVGAVLLIFSILTVTYSIAGKQVILCYEAGVTVPLRDIFKNISQISYRSVLVMLTLPFRLCPGTTFIPSLHNTRMSKSATLCMEKIKHKGVQWPIPVHKLPQVKWSNFKSSFTMDIYYHSHLLYSLQFVIPHENKITHLKIEQNFVITSIYHMRKN